MRYILSVLVLTSISAWADCPNIGGTYQCRGPNGLGTWTIAQAVIRPDRSYVHMDGQFATLTDDEFRKMDGINYENTQISGRCTADNKLIITMITSDEVWPIIYNELKSTWTFTKSGSQMDIEISSIATKPWPAQDDTEPDIENFHCEEKH